MKYQGFPSKQIGVRRFATMLTKLKGGFAEKNYEFLSGVKEYTEPVLWSKGIH